MITASDFEARGQLVYMDNAATTAIDQSVIEEMEPYLEERFGNPETVYELGAEARHAVEKARAQVADVLGCLPEAVFFTSGGTESNNWAIKGYNMTSGGCIAASAVEHASVLEGIKWMSKCFSDHYTHTIIPVDDRGRIDLNELGAELETGMVGLVSLQYGNNEVGTIQPISEVAEMCHRNGAILHCDACQAFGKVKFDVEDLDVDLLSVSAHKLHGPMGVGALYVKKGVDIEPLLHGGGQESGLRSGTLAVPNIVGFGRAAELSKTTINREMETVRRMVNNMAENLVHMGMVRNGDPDNRLPHILSVSFPGIPASTIVGELAKRNICVSMGSACRMKKRSSHVLTAMGKTYMENNQTIRISPSVYSTRQECVLVIQALQQIVKQPNLDYL